MSTVFKAFKAEYVLDLNMERLPVELTVVWPQPGPVSDDQWSTGLCECWGNMGDCEYSSSSGMPYRDIYWETFTKSTTLMICSQLCVGAC